jgi:hypothetical protein
VVHDRTFFFCTNFLCVPKLPGMRHARAPFPMMFLLWLYVVVVIAWEKKKLARNKNFIQYRVDSFQARAALKLTVTRAFQRMKELSFDVRHEKAKSILGLNARCLFGRLARAMTNNVIFQVL